MVLSLQEAEAAAKRAVAATWISRPWDHAAAFRHVSLAEKSWNIHET